MVSLACVFPKSVVVYLVTVNSSFLNEGKKKKIHNLACLCLCVKA